MEITACLLSAWICSKPKIPRTSCVGTINQNYRIMTEKDLLLMEFRQSCYGLMEWIIREYDNLSCSVRATSRGSFTCVIHARGGICDEIVDSEAQKFYLFDTRHQMIRKYDALTQFVWLNGDKRE